MAWEAVYKYYYWARMNVRLFRLRYRSPELYLWHGQQMQVRCHILAKSINFTYDTLWWFAMRYRYHEVESLRPQLPVSPLPARSSSQALVSLFPSAFPQHPYRSLQKPPYELKKIKHARRYNGRRYNCAILVKRWSGSENSTPRSKLQ